MIVSNNNPDVDLTAWLPARPRVELLQQPRHARSGLRFLIAARTDADHFVSVDDDLFVTAEQIDRLLAHLADEPGVPHGGPWGQRLVRMPNGRIAWRGPLYPDQRVDVLNRMYAFTREHARRFVALAARLGEPDPATMGPIDDVVLSHCGATRPLAHDLGPWEDCPSSHDADIAIWRQPGFVEARNAAIGRLRAMARARDRAGGA